MAKTTPSLFSLMTRLTAETRQKIAERRRALKALQDVEERLREAEKGKWHLEYWKHGKKIEELPL